MNSNGSKQCYVSTFKIQLKPPSALLPVRNGPESEDSWTSKKRADTGFSTRSSSKGLEPPTFVEPLQDCHVDEGKNITLRAIIAGSLPIKVSWLHNGEVALFGKASFDGREVSFVLKESLPEDAGAYTCLIENRAGKTSCCAAVFIRDFETMHSLKNQVSSSTTSAPKSLVENGRPLQSPADEQLKSKETCTAPTCPDRLDLAPKEVIPKKKANSESGAALRFKNPPQQLTLKAGRAARVTCSFSSSPPVVSCWIRNKEQIIDGPEVWVETTDLSSTLVIAEVTTEHRGRYTVVARDRRSSAQHTLTLSVIETPQPPASCPVISFVSTTSLALSWSGPCYDGGTAILGYVVEIKNPGVAESADWRKLTDECTSTSYVVSALQAHQEYCFRVRAYNEVGISQPGPVSPVVRMEQKDFDKPQKEDPQNYASVTIDSAHKVSDDYILQEKLGVGKFGQVFKLIHKETGQVCAGKFYKGRRAKERDAARKEIELMNYLHHPKLVQCLAAYDQKPEMVMVMEFIAGGELFERIVDDNFEHTERASVHYVQQILEGVAFMHQQNIVHLDLKPENIVCVDKTGTFVKIIDFGLASKLDNTTPLKVMHGTPEFVAPEVINYEPVCLATDMWSIGVICYILLSGESPFQGDDDAETLASVTAAQWEFSEESFEEITQEAKDFISSLLIKQTMRRMTCKQALAHPWMAAFDSGELEAKNLSKEKMKKFLARQKWKKAGKALLALKRMALLSKSESSASPPITPGEESPFSPEAEHALQTLEHKMQGAPQFTQSLKDQTVTSGSRARLSCHLTGYPDPEVVWLRGKEPLVESPSVQIEYEEDGCCTLVISQVGPEDGDLYTCRASNNHGEVFCSAKLTVQE
ncbi:myosin light chain kinase, smooth muscle isoform X1 [Takifugu flavidus]|uniref:myosin light chain kinase, smooth muscle isoform X1 n=2 Tax=Takifugu flavidus TaxID=433684 RepID=UPI0025449B62|nr:myosin light chain kinase, smooth muscle isoform X1 [Takifugu flavidus]